MRFLILGCNGMAGHLISLYLKERGHDVFGFARKKSNLVSSVSGNAEDTQIIKDIVRGNKYDTIINCIGILNRSAEENKTRAVYLNSFFPHYLAELTERTSTQVIHMSTDCVFSGERGHYTEGELRDGRTFYDRTKALGELEDEKNITFRNSIVGPDINRDGIGLLNWFMQQHGEVEGYTRAIWTGQTTLQLAKTMEVAAKERVHGLYNAVPDTSISKCELLHLFNRYMRKGKVKILPVEGMIVDKSLKRTRWDFSYRIPDYEQMVVELAHWMEAHKSLYPHYDL